MISPSSQWVRFIFFSRRYNEVKQFKRYFVSLSRMSSSHSFATRLKSLRFCAAFLTRVCSFSVWHLWRFFGSSLLQQKKHCFKVFQNSRLFFFFFFALFFIFKFMLQLPDLSPFSFPFNFCFRLCLLYAAIHDLGNKALFSGKVLTAILQVLTYFVEPYIFYLKHLVNRQNSGTHLNCRLSYGTNFFQGQNLKTWKTNTAC